MRLLEFVGEGLARISHQLSSRGGADSCPGGASHRFARRRAGGTSHKANRGEVLPGCGDAPPQQKVGEKCGLEI